MELDARTIRMAVLAAALLLVIFLGAVAPHEAKFVFACAIDVGLLVASWLKGKPGGCRWGSSFHSSGLIGALRLAKPTSYSAWPPRIARTRWRRPIELHGDSEGALADPS